MGWFLQTCAILSAFLLAAVLPCGAQMRFSNFEGDPNTLHLWHLDEAAPPFLDHGSYSTPLGGLLNGAAGGAPSMEGLGTGVSFSHLQKEGRGAEPPHGPILLARAQLDQGTGDNVGAPFPIMGPDGSFTMEAVVKFDVLPSETTGYAADIITMDDEADTKAFPTRADDPIPGPAFLFRIEKPGFLSFIRIRDDLIVSCGLAAIPTTGPNAINTTDWFHVAVTYNAREIRAGNLRLYWTRLGPGVKAANEIGRGTMNTLTRHLGDFAIGNTGKLSPNGALEYFPGTIDEVRISAIARRPFDFFFVSPEDREYAEDHLFSQPFNDSIDKIALEKITVDDVPLQQPADLPLVLGPGYHRLDFDFGFPEESLANTSVKCKLEGLDNDWHEGSQGMSLDLEMLDGKGNLLAQAAFPTNLYSPGWQGNVLTSPLVGRTELVFVPGATRQIRLTMSSGSPATTGTWFINGLFLTRSEKPGENLWDNDDFRNGRRLNEMDGNPSGWERSGSDPSIARMVTVGGGVHCLGFVDGEKNHYGTWTHTQSLHVPPSADGEEFLFGWSEAYAIIPGASLRASYSNMPAGNYTFRAIAKADYQVSLTSSVAFPVVIRPPFWREPWFQPTATAAGALLLGGGLFLSYRRRARARIAAAHHANAIERDRARIARDMHDDLGTRGTLIIHGAQFIRDSIDEDPDGARHQADRLISTSSNLVRAIDELVWAINPANDTLEDLADHLAGVAQEIFAGAPVVLRISIPTELPAILIRSDFRSQFSLAVKEALHNVLKHAGPCEASLELLTEERDLTAIISDKGRGFDPNHPEAGNGLANLVARAREMNGTCEIESKPNFGTRVILRCPLPDPALNVKT